MGCDIHCIIEYKHKTINGDRWDSFGYNEINPGRNYEWFSELAGVRGSPSGDRALATGFGIPKDMSFATQMATTIYVREDDEQSHERSVKRSDADKWVENKVSTYVENWTRTVNGVEKPYRITHPDWHSHGWCNLKDWKKSTRGSKNLTIKAMNAILDTYKKNGCDVRVVFWFDN